MRRKSMRISGVSKWLKKVMVFVFCVIIGLNSTVSIGKYGDSNNRPFVQFGVDKVYAENPWVLIDSYTMVDSFDDNDATLWQCSGYVAYGARIIVYTTSNNSLDYEISGKTSTGKWYEGNTWRNIDVSKYNVRIDIRVSGMLSTSDYNKLETSIDGVYTIIGTNTTSSLSTTCIFDATKNSTASIFGIINSSKALGDSRGIWVSVYTQLRNQNPTISVTSPSLNGTYSEVTGHTAISFKGTVNDSNTGDIITTKYNIDGGTTQTVSGTVTTSGSFTTTNISVGGLSEGNHNLNVWCVDNQGAASATTTIPFKIDKTAPVLGTTSVSSTTNSITIGGSATDSIAGLNAYPYKYTVSTKTATSWLTATSYTQSSLTPNTQYTTTFEARDAVGHISSKVQSIYTKAVVPAVTVNNPTSYTLDVSMSDANPSTTPYQIIVNSSKYVTPEGTLTTSPVWITPAGKKITVKGLSPSTAYTFRVKAKNGNGVETSLSSYYADSTSRLTCEHNSNCYG